jgi:hypothetical protein
MPRALSAEITLVIRSEFLEAASAAVVPLVITPTVTENLSGLTLVLELPVVDMVDVGGHGLPWKYVGADVVLFAVGADGAVPVVAA